MGDWYLIACKAKGFGYIGLDIVPQLITAAQHLGSRTRHHSNKVFAEWGIPT